MTILDASTTLTPHKIYLHMLHSPFTCSPKASCSNGDLYLEDGLSEYEGRLVVCYNNTWGTVGNNGWDHSASEVACRQMDVGETQ